MTGDRRGRLLAATAASLALIIGSVAISTARTGTSGPDTVAAPTPSPSTPTAPSGGSDAPSTPPENGTADALALLATPDAAAGATAEELLRAGLRVAQGPWRELSDPAWPIREERPVYVVRVELSEDLGRVEADVVLAWRATSDGDAVTLRLLAAADALAAAGAGISVDAVTVNGERAGSELDTGGARLLVPIEGGIVVGDAHLLRIQVAYDVPDVAAVTDDGGPAGFGLLSRTGGVANLGHWLPLLTLPGEDGPMVAWGDVGGFPVAIWSVTAVHPGTLVTGGADGACDQDADRPEGARCTRARGVALRDVSAVAYRDDPTVGTQRVGGVEVRAMAAADTPQADLVEVMLEESATAMTSFTERFGPLAWRQFDVVSAPLAAGAAGMEFPGLVIIDSDAVEGVRGGFGTFVIAHEVAHQWFHALVGVGSLSDPVVDESLAQYLAYLFWSDLFGPALADEFAQRNFLGRYLGARSRGLVDEPPAQPLSEFEGSEPYGALVYARAPLAWVAAEEVVGRDAVVVFIAGLVRRYGLGQVTDEQVLEDAADADPELGEVLARYWLDPTPVAQPSG